MSKKKKTNDFVLPVSAGSKKKEETVEVQAPIVEETQEQETEMFQIQTDAGATVAKEVGVERSPKWDRARRMHLRKQPGCAICGESKTVSVHHIIPFHYAVSLGRPDLELDGRNLITLCDSNDGVKTQDHHLYVGHFGNFKLVNINVVSDSEKYKDVVSKLILEDKDYKENKKNKLPALDKMTDKEKEEFKALMEKLYPIIQVQ